MADLDRRALLRATIGVAAAMAATGLAVSPAQTAGAVESAEAGGVPLSQRRLFSAPRVLPPRLPVDRAPVVLYRPPVATPSTPVLTVDDGVDSPTLGAYVELARRTGLRLTFFVNGVYPSWTQHRAALLPLVESGQAQLGNHTWSHPHLLTLGDAAVAAQIRKNDVFLKRTFGVDARPWFRPPFGEHDARTDGIAFRMGYSRITLWEGILGDYLMIDQKQLLAYARTWLKPGHIVLGHANHPTVVPLFDQLLQLIVDRRATPLTLTEAFGAAHR